MGDRSRIEWTDFTWNVTTGCTKVSPGCDNCYITRTPPFRMAHRKFDKPGVGGTTGVLLHPERLTLPLRMRKPRRIFVNSLADLFHDDVPDELIAKVFAVMALTPHHTYQVLTKRHGRMRSLLASAQDNGFHDAVAAEMAQISSIGGIVQWPLPNVWLGVSVEDQKRADLRIPALIDTPAAVRFLSCEPLLGPVKLPFFDEVNGCTCGGGTPWGAHEPGCGLEPGLAWGDLHWVIAGGESGHGARPMDPAWVRSLRDQCAMARTAFLFKQWGGRTPKANGRELDGRTWDQFPERVA